MRLSLAFLLGTTTCTGFLAASPAYAQGATGGGLQEIVVTAQKREQSIQDVPASVSALTSEALQVNRIQNIRDLDSVSPGLTVTTIPSGSASPTWSMRGVIGLGTGPGADKGIALYLDGVYIGAASGSTFNLAEIERIEVLKGPQGTLFGRNSTGGAISITTLGPIGELRLKQRLTAGNFGLFETVTRIDTPQFGPFSAAITFAHNERRGDIRNLGAGTVWNGSANGLPSRLVAAKHLGGENGESFSASLKADISPDIDLVYKFDKSSRDAVSDGVGQVMTHPVPTVNFFNANSGFPLVVSERRPKALNNWASVGDRVKAEGHVLTASWQVSDSIRVKNILAHRTSSYFAPLADLFGTGGLFAAPGVPFLTVVTLSGGTSKQFSEEFQVNYDSSFLTLTGGGLWYDQDNKQGQAGTGFNSINFAVAPGFVLPAPANAPVQQSEVDVRSWAVYAQGEVHVTEALDLVVGVRHTDDKKRGIDRTVPIFSDLNYDDSRLTYNVGVNFQPSKELLLYGKYSTGYISGGKLATLAYAPETAKSWEAGIKGDWLNNRLRTNLSVYSVKYNALQVGSSGLYFGVPEAAQVLINAGDARARGFELEVTAVPVDSITLGVNVGYLDFKYTQLDPRFEAAGQTVPSARPKWTANLSAQYESEPIFGEAYFTLRADANYRSAHAGGAYTNLQEESWLPASWVVNGVASIKKMNWGGADVTVSAWVKNMFDEDVPRYILVSPFSAAASYQRARTYGADLVFEF